MPAGMLRQPRAWLSVGGSMVTLLSCEVTVGRMAIAGEFQAVMALDDPSNPGAAFWSSAAPIAASVVATNDVNGGGTATLIQGTIDKVDICFDQRTVTVTGQDRVHELIEARIDQNNQNQSASQVVSDLVSPHGFNLHIDSTAGMAGKTFDMQNYSYLSDVMNKWDAIQELAHQSGKVAYVSGNDFFFVSPESSQGGVYSIFYTPPTPHSYATGNFMTLHCRRDIPFAQGVQALSNSYHTFNKEAYGSASADASPEGFN